MSRVAKSLSLCFALAAVVVCAMEPAEGDAVEGDAVEADAVEVHVSDEDGAAVGHIAIYVESAEPRAAQSGNRPKAIMNQRDHAFVPHILVVETGTDIEFPNSDSVSHHVYSFSPIKKFELPLYKGRRYPPERFDRAGLVTLGCNIHDDMLGYILVVATPHFALTDAAGIARFDGLTPGRYTVHAWTPRLRPSHLPEPIEIDVADGQGETIGIRFTRKLYPSHADGDSSLSWSNY